MSYERFERAVLGAAAAAVLALVAVSASHHAPTAHVVGELMLWPVLAAGLHYGRRTGLVAALTATTVYIVLTIPLMATANGLTPDAFLLIAGCIVGYGVVGILGGEMACRLRYLYARLERVGAIDEWSHAYSQRFAVFELERRLAEHTRYGRDFSVLLVDVAPSAYANGQAKERRAAARAATNLLRGDVRIVDQVARLDDGRFFVLLPETAAPGAAIVANRLCANVRQLFDLESEDVSVRSLSVRPDEAALVSLCENLSSLGRRDVPQEPSGAYSSLGASDL
jgi:GGDEF domain-containing protein